MSESALRREHRDHLLAEGFTQNQIQIMQAAGVRSFTSADTQAYNIGARDFSQGERYVNPSGLYFPFSKDWGQIRCDNPPVGDNGKPRKYLNPVGKGSRAWLPKDCEVVTEGPKDAWAGTLHGGVPTGALAGVSHYQKALPKGCGYTILFDADGWRNPQVFNNLINAGLWVSGKVALLPEMPGEPKAGLCEYFKAGHTAEDYKRLLAKAKPPKKLLKEWPKHWPGLDDEKEGECIDKALQLAAKLLNRREQASLITLVSEISGIGKTVLKEQLRDEAKALKAEVEGTKNQALVANAIAEKYTKVLAYDADQHEWLWYGRTREGLWDTVADGIVSQRIKRELDTLDALEGKYSAGYHHGVLSLVQVELTRDHWNSEPTLIPFSNGVLDLKSRQLRPHSPDWGLRWQLPRPYVVIEHATAASFPKIDAWLDFVTKGSSSLKHLLLCWLNAVLLGRFNLQKFLHLVGPGGTGKGTYMRLASALIGQNNTHTSNLDVFCNDKFETSNIVDKRLLLFSDEDKYSGRLGAFKQATGGDDMRAEKKQKNPFLFTYQGVAMISSNFPIFAGDTSSGIARRIITAPFTQRVPLEKRGDDFEAQLWEELPQLTNFLLQMDERIVKNTLLGVSEQAPEVTELQWEMRMRTDAVAAWLNECVVKTSDNSFECVGRDIEDTSTLFGNYQQWCRQNGSKPKGSREFTPALLELCQSIIGWKDVRKGQDSYSRRAIVYGLKLRDEWSTEPNPIDEIIRSHTHVGGVPKGAKAIEGMAKGADEGIKPLENGHLKVSKVSVCNHAREKNCEAPELSGSEPLEEKDTHFLRDKEKVDHPFDTFESSQGKELTPSSNTFATPSTAEHPFNTVESVQTGTRVKLPPYRTGHTGTVLTVNGDTVRVRRDGESAKQAVDYKRYELRQVNGQPFQQHQEFALQAGSAEAPSITEGHPEWHEFERGLIEAQTYEELQAVKRRTPESIRLPCMKVWEADRRRSWLKAKAERLKALKRETCASQLKEF